MKSQKPKLDSKAYTAGVANQSIAGLMVLDRESRQQLKSGLTAKYVHHHQNQMN